MPAAGPQGTRKRQLKKKKPAGQYTPGSTTPVSYPKPKPKVKPRPVKAPAGDASGGYNLKPAKKIARKQAEAKKRRQSEVKDTKSDRELSTARTFKQFDRYKDLQEKVRGKRLQRAFRDDDVKTIEKISDRHAASASAASPVLKVLDQTTRPLHAIAGAARKDVQEFKKHGPAGLVGHGSLKEAGKGIRNETKNTFSDVLKEAGVKNKGVAGAVGFGLDVALDPTTYATFGASSPARAAARSAARKAERTAVKSGSGKAAGQAAETQARKRADAAKSPLTPKQAKTVRKTAERKHVKRAGQKAADKVTTGATNRGLDVRFAGQSVPGVTRVTAAAKRTPRKVVSATRVDRTRAGAAVDRAQQKARDAARSTAAEVNPNITPVGVERETYQAMRRAARTARAKSQRGDVYAALSAKSFRDRIGEDNFQKVLYAVEEGTVAKLPGPLRAEAHRWVNLNRKRLKQERRAGIKVGDVTRDARVKAVGKVPDVTADVEGAQKAVRAALVERNRTEREHGRQTHKAGVAEGKARVLVGQSDRKRRGRVMYHVVRDSGVSHKTKLAAIKNEGLRPSSNGYVYLYDDAAQAAEFAKGGGKILKVNVDDLPLGGAEGAATRTVKGAIPADRIVRGKVAKRKTRPAGTRPTKTLARLESERGKLYAMEKGQVVGKARQAVRDAEAALEATKAQARKQRGHRIRKQNALKRAEAAPVDYVKHLRIDLDDVGSKVASGKGPGRVKMDSAKKRESGLLREENLANPGRFSEDAGVIEATRASEHSRSLAKAEMNRALAQVGRRFDKKQDARSQLRDNEAVYKAEGTDLVRVKPEDIKSGKAPSGQLVILNEKAVERTAGTVQTAGSRTTPGVVFDKAQGIWKLGATVVNPGYYVRNFAGEAQNAYLLERPDRLLRNAVTSGKALKEVRKREEAVRKGEKYVPGKHGELIDKAEAVGAVRAGQYARELGQQLSSEKAGRRGSLKKGAGPLRTIGRARDNVEDIFRLASFKGGLDRGLKPAQAQQRAATNHFDYGDLSESERKFLRRVMPFYTFSSRNIPLQIRSLVQKPGKFANYQKIREELGKAFGFEDGWEDRLSEVEQRSAPFPVKWKGKEFTLSLGPSGLPLTDLNEFPVELLADPTNPASYNAVLDEWLTRAGSMVSPAFKTPVELHENISFFFRDQLERDYGPLVPAPAWVKVMPKEFKEMTGYTDNFRNLKDGSSGPGWRAKADYLVNILPGPAQFANRLAREGSSKEQSTGSKVVQYFGPRLRPVEVKGVQVNKAFDEQEKLRKRQAILRQQNHPVNGEKISADNPTPEYTRSLAASRALDKKMRRLRGIPEKAPSTPTRRVTKRPAPSSTGRFQFGGESSSGSSSSGSGSSGRFTFK